MSNSRAEMAEEIGRALYGASWQTETARTLGVADRTVRRWAAREAEPAPGVIADLAAELERRLAAGRAVLRHARGAVVGVDAESRRQQCVAARESNLRLLVDLRAAKVTEPERGRIALGTLSGRYDAVADGHVVTAYAHDTTSDWEVRLVEDVREHPGEAGGRDEHGWLDEPKARDVDGDTAAVAARLRGRVRDALVVHLAQRLPSIIETIEGEVEDAQL